MTEKTELFFQVFLQVATAILSIVFFRKTTFYKLLCFFLIVVAVTECVGFYQIYYDIRDEYSIHYISSFFQFNLIFLMYYFLLDTKLKKVVLFLCVIFNTFYINVFFERSLFPYLLVIGCLNSSILSFLYLRNLLLSNEILNYKKHLPFWVSVGFLIFYIASIPFFTEMAFMKSRYLFFLIRYLIILMNIFIIIGLVWSKKEPKY